MREDEIEHEKWEGRLVATALAIVASVSELTKHPGGSVQCCSVRWLLEQQHTHTLLLTLEPHQHTTTTLPSPPLLPDSINPTAHSITTYQIITNHKPKDNPSHTFRLTAVA